MIWDWTWFWKISLVETKPYTSPATLIRAYLLVAWVATQTEMPDTFSGAFLNVDILFRSTRGFLSASSLLMDGLFNFSTRLCAMHPGIIWRWVRQQKHVDYTIHTQPNVKMSSLPSWNSRHVAKHLIFYQLCLDQYLLSCRSVSTRGSAQQFHNA